MLNTGLFALYKIFGEHIRYALSKGWLPVVDMQYYPNAYLPPDKLGKENSWEYFFEQPLRIGLQQAYGGENIVLSGVEVKPQLYESMAFFENRDNVLTEWRMLVKLGLLKIKPALAAEISAVRQKLFAPNEKILGVLLRGTDYVQMRPYGHPIPPPIVKVPSAPSSTSCVSGNATKFSSRPKTKTLRRFLKTSSKIFA